MRPDERQQLTTSGLRQPKTPFEERFGQRLKEGATTANYFVLPIRLDRINTQPFTIAGDEFSVEKLWNKATIIPTYMVEVYVRFDKQDSPPILLHEGLTIRTRFERFFITNSILDENSFVSVIIGEHFSDFRIFPQPPDDVLRLAVANAAAMVPVAPGTAPLATGTMFPVRNVSICNMEIAGGNRIFVGDVNVTVLDGFPVLPGEKLFIDKTHLYQVYAVAENAPVEIRILDQA
jgi:hypothetical protein